ncbi:MAG: hypothetical protein EZS28_025359 [Streblomastix strix]|uniref:Uncharacterized protein n=1 Tax=Streblomastix strix TaxID=222440 RepID=A0A5J4V9Q9_9EUKA|nr:MAG: hypothetical protein EZS28_025359 [Streblomastix strix]
MCAYIHIIRKIKFYWFGQLMDSSTILKGEEGNVQAVVIAYEERTEIKPNQTKSHISHYYQTSMTKRGLRREEELFRTRVDEDTKNIIEESNGLDCDVELIDDSDDECISISSEEEEEIKKVLRQCSSGSNQIQQEGPRAKLPLQSCPYSKDPYVKAITKHKSPAMKAKRVKKRKQRLNRIIVLDLPTVQETRMIIQLKTKVKLKIHNQVYLLQVTIQIQVQAQIIGNNVTHLNSTVMLYQQKKDKLIPTFKKYKMVITHLYLTVVKIHIQAIFNFCRKKDIAMDPLLHYTKNDVNLGSLIFITG